MNTIKQAKIVIVVAASFASLLTGCVGYVDHPHHARVYTPGPTVVVHDDYVYYPSYQVYYSSTRRHYVYLDGRSWVTRSSPPRVSASVLFASPSVSLDFHDSPQMHHATVVQTYPKTWTPPGWNHGNKAGGNEGHDQGNKNGHKKDKKGRK
jgi:hypothetical protein